jgi:branched-chain amino acid transport system ATP-binding protein
MTRGPGGRTLGIVTKRSAAQVALSLRDVRVRFGGVVALAGVGLDLAPGLICGIIGPNGAGKTTLLDVVSGLTEPQAGRIFLAGQDITTCTSTRIARAGIRRTFQQIQTFGWLPVEDNVLVPLEWHGGGGGVLADLVSLPWRHRYERDRRERAAEALALCGVADLAGLPSSILPAGQARLVEVARAIVDRPRVLLLDEPTSGLDPGQSERLAGCVREVRDRFGTTVLLVEHNVEFVMALCDQVVVLNLGQVIASGTAEQTMRDPAVHAAYLGGSPPGRAWPMSPAEQE